MSQKPLSNLALLKPLILRNEASGFALPADGMYQLVPLGNAPNLIPGDKPRRVLQIMDQAALAALKNHALAMAADLKAQGLPPEVPTDFFHKEENASAWVQLDTVQERTDGLYFQLRLTNDGEASLTGGKVRFFSPNFAVKGLVALKEENGVVHVRPTEFDTVWLGGLTNNHNFRQLKPMSNGLGGDDTKPDNQPANTMPPWREKLINSLIKQGFLTSASADDTAIDAALDKFTNSLEALQTERLANDLTTYKDAIPAGQEEFVKDLLKNNRPAAIAFLEGTSTALKNAKPAAAETKPQERLTNGQHKGNELPTKLVNDEKVRQQAITDRTAEQTKLVNSIVQELGGPATPGVNLRAWSLAAQRNPDLFKDLPLTSEA